MPGEDESQQPLTTKVYHGKPENKKDPNAQQGPTRSKTAKPPKHVSSTLPPATQVRDASHVQLKTGSPADGAIFMSSTYAVEVNSNTQFSASLPSLL